MKDILRVKNLKHYMDMFSLTLKGKSILFPKE